MAISVPNLEALTLVQVAGLREGMQAWVTSEEYSGAALFVLHRDVDIPPDGANIIAPAAGSPGAGGRGARWVRFRPPSNARSIQTAGCELTLMQQTLQTEQQLLMSQGIDMAGGTMVMVWIAIAASVGPAGRAIFRVLVNDEVQATGLIVPAPCGGGAINFRRGDIVPVPKGFYRVDVTWAVNDSSNLAVIDPQAFEGHGSIMLAEVPI